VKLILTLLTRRGFMEKGPAQTGKETLENIPQQESCEPMDIEGPPASEDIYAYSHKQYDIGSTRVMIKIPAEKDSQPVTGEPNRPGGNATGDEPEAGPPPRDDLLFCGVVRGDNQRALQGVAVMVAACYRDGREQPLEFTFTDEEGNYTVAIPALQDYSLLDGFKVRACGTSRTAEITRDGPDKMKEKPQPASPNRNYHNLLKLIYNNPNKSIYELIKHFY
jgi:hypothetical protein